VPSWRDRGYRTIRTLEVSAEALVPGTNTTMALVVDSIHPNYCDYQPKKPYYVLGLKHQDFSLTSIKIKIMVALS